MQLKDWPQFLDLIQAIKDGKTIQMEFPDGWQDLVAETRVVFDGPRKRYRIKPEAKLREWKPDEVPLGAQIRIKPSLNEETVKRAIIIACCANYIHYHPMSREQTTYAFALQNCEHSTDGGKTFKPCGVEETI